MKNKNIISVFFRTALRMGDSNCARFKRGENWEDVSWSELALQIRRLSAGLIKSGIRAGERIVICGKTSIDWTVADCAILAAGGVTVPVYPSLSAERIAYIIKDAAPSLIFAENDELGRRIHDALKALGLKTIPIYVFEGRALKHYAELHNQISDGDMWLVDEMVAKISPESDATIVYTSGTTGEQKGVVLTHRNLLAEVASVEKVFDFKPNEVGLMCLPLAHVLGRMMQFYQLAHGCRLAYAEGLERLAQNYIELKPDFVCAVPRMLEKFYELLQAYLKNLPFGPRHVFDWALSVGRAYSKCMRKYRKISLFLKLQYVVADFLVFCRIRKRLGGRIRSFICGGAPLKEEICKFFHAIGVLVLEGYGLTETFAAVTVNRPDDFHFGTVGKTIPEVDIKFGTDGEVLIKGPIVFREYRNRPEDTKNSFTEDGWFKSGDIGEYSRDGFLRITGRKKDIIITAGGKNIAPQMIEALMATSPLVSQVMVYGDGRKYLIALVTLNKQEVARLPEKGESYLNKLISGHIEEQNKKLATYETIKKFAIIDTEFSVESGELTPTLKLRRAFTGEKYKDVIGRLYS